MEIKTIIELLLLLLVSIEGTLFILSPIYFIYRNKKMKEEIKKLEENIPKENDISYFRDKVGQISPGVLTFILKKKIKYKESIMASILSLLYKKYIKIENNKIIPTDKTKENLDSNEKYIINSHKFIFSFPEFKKYWKNYVISDCIEKGYIKRKEEKYEKYIIVLIGIIFFIVSFILLDLDRISIFLLLFSNFFLFAIDVFLYNGIIISTNDNHKYIRTEKGQELYIKLIGLKKFLNDFTNVDEITKEEIYVWEDYMIYAILFELSGHLNKEVNEEYEKLLLVEKS